MISKHILLKAIKQESTKWYRNSRGTSFKSMVAVRKPSGWQGSGSQRGTTHTDRRYFGALPFLRAWRQILTLSELSNVWKVPFALQRKQAEFLNPFGWWKSGDTESESHLPHEQTLVKWCLPESQIASSFCFSTWQEFARKKRRWGGGARLKR